MTALLKSTSLLKCVFIYLLIIMMSACGGSSGAESNANNPSEPLQPTEPVVGTPDPLNPDSANPDPINSIDGLAFQLIGEKVMRLRVGEAYLEPGAVAMSDTEGDISSAIRVLNTPNVMLKGDYVIRYQITDNAGQQVELTRMVRVFNDIPVVQSQRVKGETAATLGYLEHLPVNYGQVGNERAPLIIFNHGAGATGTSILSHVECCGLPRVLSDGNWDSGLPFVVLSPQREVGINTPGLDTFVEYALRTYEVDPKRVYMVGWSQGANATMLYAIAHPQKLAAIVPTAGGLFGGSSNACQAATVPMWVFLGNQDSSFINTVGVNSVNTFRNCQPVEPVRLTRFLNADHFETSIWPFLTQENHTVDSDNDAFDQNIFEWLLQRSL